jgi:predicted TIM-barrel fold metal-dependent hydrolase
MAKIIDFHAHILGDPFARLSKFPLSKRLSEIISHDKVHHLRKQARAWMKPIASSLHSAQTMVRHFPDFTRRQLDELVGLLPLPSLLVEATPSDLLEEMDEAGVELAVVIAHPPLISNDFIIETCEANPRLIPVVNIPIGTFKPGLALKEYVKRGAKALKIHAAADGEGPESPRYRKLILTASELGLPVIIHTGCIQSRLLYKQPSHGEARIFSKWFEKYPETPFILAHMNFHEPHVALDICEDFPNVFVDTSWQPAEVIGEAARRIGADRVLFGTDWPLVGNNLKIGRERVERCLDIGLLNQTQVQLILGENARKLLGQTLDAS